MTTLKQLIQDIGGCMAREVRVNSDVYIDDGGLAICIREPGAEEPHTVIEIGGDARCSNPDCVDGVIVSDPNSHSPGIRACAVCCAFNYNDEAAAYVAKVLKENRS